MSQYLFCRMSAHARTHTHTHTHKHTYTVYTLFLVSYSGEYQEMVFDTHPTHTPTRNISFRFTKEIPFSVHNLHNYTTAVFFCSTFSVFFNQTAAAWPRSVWISHKRNVAISWFCAVLQCVCVECTFQCTYHLYRGTAHFGTTLALLHIQVHTHTYTHTHARTHAHTHTHHVSAHIQTS